MRRRAKIYPPRSFAAGRRNDDELALSYTTSACQDQLWKGLRPAGEKVVAKKKPSALDALAKLDEERAALSEREAALKREAALELGAAVLIAGGAVLRPERLKSIVESVVRIGADEALRRLSGSAPASAADPGKGVGESVSEEVHDATRHGA
jgi:hypothetical protein